MMKYNVICLQQLKLKYKYFLSDFLVLSCSLLNQVQVGAELTRGGSQAISWFQGSLSSTWQEFA